MNKLSLTCLVLVGASMVIPLSSQAQDLHPSRRLSPLGLARTTVGDTYVKVTFSRPYKRGRDNVFGAGDVMHPHGQIWRFGANEPTEITFSGPVSIGGSSIPAGTYTLFVTPGADTWKVHVNDMRGGGAGDLDPDKDIVVVDVAPTTVEEEVDQFTIDFMDAEGGIHLVASWLNWELHLPIGVES